jgi:hypothetical protein
MAELTIEGGQLLIDRLLLLLGGLEFLVCALKLLVERLIGSPQAKSAILSRGPRRCRREPGEQ